MMKFHPSPEQLSQSEGLFNEKQALRRLLENAQKSKTLSSARLFAFAQGAPDRELEDRLKDELCVRRTYQLMLKRLSLFYIPEAVAASSETYPERIHEGCKIRLQPSRAQDDQLYLILEFLDQRTEFPVRMNVMDDTGTQARMDLPEARNGIIQTIIEKSSVMAMVLANPKAEVFLT